MEEIWKDAIYIDRNGNVIDFEGWYQVSNKGRVRSFRAHGGSRCSNKRSVTPTLLKTKKEKSTNGYISVNMKIHNSKSKSWLVHRLVLSTFVEIPEHLKNEKWIDVNHKDENKRNNNLDNLEWCSRLENNLYGTRLQRSIEKGAKTRSTYEWKKKNSGGYIHNSRAVVGVSIETGEIVEFESMTGVNEYFNNKLADRSVSATIRGKQKTAYGYKWYYKEDYEKQCK